VSANIELASSSLDGPATDRFLHIEQDEATCGGRQWPPRLQEIASASSQAITTQQPLGKKGAGDVALPKGDEDMHKDISTSKVFYRPIEAAIRWAGLLRYEPMILASIASPRACRSRWTARDGRVRLYSERIYDGILNGELPFGGTASRSMTPRCSIP
jgi:hypothetical protein